jgi:HAD superfamily phosphatase (TIGR01668 family)
MSFSLLPHICRHSIYELAPRLFLNRGVRLVFLDVDNTLAPYGSDRVPQRLLDWGADMRGAGLELFILSNNRGRRPELFANRLGIGFEKRARKPFTRKLRAVLTEKGIPPAQAALVGDQIFTDVLCARRAGLLAVLVKPISLKNPLLTLRYGLEAPFRAAYGWKYRKRKG